MRKVEGTNPERFPEGLVAPGDGGSLTGVTAGVGIGGGTIGSGGGLGLGPTGLGLGVRGLGLGLGMGPAADEFQ